MAERKASNRYYPPEFWDQKNFSDKSNLNTFRGESWRNRGAQVNSKLLTQGRDVIRFEMPFDIWCGGCNEVIHKGVRFNADKKKAGKYLSTTIWEFDMKCHLCDHRFAIRTDPQNTTYLCVSGCRAKKNEWEEDEDTTRQSDAREKRKLDSDPFYRLEHSAAGDGSGRTADEVRARKDRPHLYNLKEVQDVRSRDDGLLNRLVRKNFRTEKREALRKEAEDAEERKRLNLAIPLLPHSEEDLEIAREQKFLPGGRDEEQRFADAKELQRRAVLLSSALPRRQSTGGSSSPGAGALVSMKAAQKSGSGVGTDNAPGIGGLRGSAQIKLDALRRKMTAGLDPAKFKPPSRVSEGLRTRHAIIVTKARPVAATGAGAAGAQASSASASEGGASAAGDGK